VSPSPGGFSSFEVTTMFQHEQPRDRQGRWASTTRTSTGQHTAKHSVAERLREQLQRTGKPDAWQELVRRLRERRKP
jgi:RecA/RadA recombinase